MDRFYRAIADCEDCCADLPDSPVCRSRNEKGLDVAYFTSPEGTPLSEVQVAILGLNPGALQGDEDKPVGKRRNRYWPRVHELLHALWPADPPTRFAGLELVYQRNRVKGRNPGRREIAHCTTRHLRQQLAELNPAAVVICVGLEPYWWLHENNPRSELRFCYVPHLTGVWGPLKAILRDGKLLPEAEERWKRCLAGEPVRLDRE